MLRLSSRLVCQNTLLRALREKRPSGSGRNLTAVIGCRYASSGPPKQAHDKFDRLFASLRHGMKEDELAMTIAALVWSTKNQNKLETLESSLPQYIKRFNKDSLYKKVNHFLANPPEDNFDSVVAASPLGETSKQEESVVEARQKPRKTTTRQNINQELPDDPSLPTPAEQLMSHLQTAETRHALELLEADEQDELRYLISKIYNDSGAEDMEALDSIAEFLSYHGAGIQYTRRLKPALEESKTDYLAEFATLTGEPIDADLLEDIDEPLSQSSIHETEIQPDNDALLRSTAPVEHKSDPFPDLMTPDPLLDSRDVLELPPDKDSPYHNRVVVRNHSSIFNEALAEQGFDLGAEDYVPTKTDETEESASSRENLPFSPAELAKFYRFPLIHRRITQQTGKGKIHRQFVLMVVGNGDGLVGYGQGKDEDASRAEAKAYAQAVRNMDWVERFEKRTIWTEMNTKLGATQLILRPRPVGFGLRCNPNLHQVLKAAGIKDISAKVWGSRNPINVIKAAFRMLQAGHAPLAMGDGIGGSGRKLNKGSGLRSKGDVERERGRQLISLRK